VTHLEGSRDLENRALEDLAKDLCRVEINGDSYSGGSSFKYQFEDGLNWFQQSYLDDNLQTNDRKLRSSSRRADIENYEVSLRLSLL